MNAPETHARGEALVRKWQGRFGLGEFRIQVFPMPEGPCDSWARSYYDLDEMWGVIDLPADESVQGPLLELLVCHELAHGLLALARSGDTNEEQACNRIARLARGDHETRLANEQSAWQLGEAYWDGDHERSSAVMREGGAIDRRKWLPIVSDALPPKEREVIDLLYWEGLSYADAAARMGVPIRTLRRWRESALTRLSEYFKKLENAHWFMARRVIGLKMPEGGAEHGVIYELHHRCPQANALIRTEVGSEDMDLLVFPVGNVGYTMPRDIPFAVESLDECSACGQIVGCWFVWKAGHVNHPGSIWTPGG